jgi:hypothetical protein
MHNVVIVLSTDMDPAEKELVIAKKQLKAAITLLTTMPFPPSSGMVLILEKVVKNARLHNATALLQVERAAAGEPESKKPRLADAGRGDEGEAEGC